MFIDVYCLQDKRVNADDSQEDKRGHLLASPSGVEIKRAEGYQPTSPGALVSPRAPPPSPSSPPLEQEDMVSLACLQALAVNLCLIISSLQLIDLGENSQPTSPNALVKSQI